MDARRLVGMTNGAKKRAAVREATETRATESGRQIRVIDLQGPRYAEARKRFRLGESACAEAAAFEWRREVH